MIAPSSPLPYVHWKNDRSVPLSEGWLAESVHHSATTAGVPNWELTTHVAKAIAYYLKSDFDENCITIDELETIMSRSLSGIGYPEIASHMKMVAPRVSIFLPEIARKAQYELLFFQLLQERLHEAMHVVVRGVRLEGLRPCVKMIEATKKWQKRCQLLSDEIVSFSRNSLKMKEESLVEIVIV